MTWPSLDDLIAHREARRAAERAAEEAAAAAKAEEAKKFAESLAAYRLKPEDKERIVARVATAFDSGADEVMLFAFPSDLCSDSGRHIHNRLEGWEETLPGATRDIWQFWHDELRPKGFLFGARVVNFAEGGIPGDVGLFVSWPKALEG
jgi:hypothetical protein